MRSFYALAAAAAILLAPAGDALAKKRKASAAGASFSAQSIAGATQAVWYIAATVVVEANPGGAGYYQETRASTCRAVLRPRGRDVTATVRCESDFVGSTPVTGSYLLTDDPASADPYQWLITGNGSMARVNFNRAGTLATGGGQIGFGQPTEQNVQQVRTATFVANRQ